MTEMRHMRGRPISVGTYNNWGCRCPDCRSAATEYQRRRRQRKETP